MRLLLPACACALTLVACRSKETAGPTSDVGGTIVIATPGEPAAVLPPLVGENAGRALSDLIFDRLAEISFDLGTVGDKTFAPRLAKSWTWSPDSLSIAFSIDPRARWHDGKPVTAGDVRFTFLATIDPKVASQNAPLLSNVDSVVVRDSLTAVVYYKRRRPEQFYDFVYQLPIMP
jgi:peptide/nickel transport system substrate-binding protein